MLELLNCLVFIDKKPSHRYITNDHTLLHLHRVHSEIVILTQQVI